jgi:hypothetical protein
MFFTDHPGVLREIKRRWGEKDHLTVDFGQIHHIDRHGTPSADGLTRVALDIELMASCDVLVMSGMSNFARPASWMRDQEPYLVGGNYDVLATSLNDPIAAPGCYRSGSIDALGKRMWNYPLQGLEIPLLP